MGDAKNLEDWKSFLRFFKMEAERWLGLLEMGFQNKDVGGSCGLQVGLVSGTVKAQCEASVDEHTTRLQVYSRRSPRKVMP